MTHPKPHPYNGWLVVDKPLGVTSTKVVSQVRKALGMRKIGHAGTLDPLASGVLPLAIGEATKTVQYIQDTTKTYEFEVTWGEARSTDDLEGEVTETSTKIPSVQEINSVLPQFLGEIEQIPPIYSAIKVDGKRAYDLARKGEEVKLKSRIVKTESLEVISSEKQGATTFRLTCGKGTYVRSLARDMAKAMGTVGYVSYLRRTQVGLFTEKNSLELKKILELGGESVVHKAWYSICEALDDILAFVVSDSDEAKLRQGQTIECPEPIGPDIQVLCVREDKVPVAMAKSGQGRIAPERVFNI